jgi:hypothetical protein
MGTQFLRQGKYAKLSARGNDGVEWVEDRVISSILYDDDIIECIRKMYPDATEIQVDPNADEFKRFI